MTDPGPVLLAWGERTRRDLPWRRTRDPWSVLMSEVMLQQTQVARAVPAYLRFVDRWPTPAVMAAGPVGDVVAAWRGLGYNGRAVRLHAAATVIVDRHQGQVPGDLPGLMALPGVGGYTARAVRAFAFEAASGVVDTNAARVLARAVAGRRLGPAEVQTLADGCVPAGRSWAWNSAVLDLGATVCTARQPACTRCPLATAGACRWQTIGGPDPAVGTAGASGRQSRFAGSDRQGRGRLVASLRLGPVAAADVAAAAGWPDDPGRAVRVVSTIVTDGLAVFDEDAAVYRLPG